MGQGKKREERGGQEAGTEKDSAGEEGRRPPRRFLKVGACVCSLSRPTNRTQRAVTTSTQSNGRRYKAASSQRRGNAMTRRIPLGTRGEMSPRASFCPCGSVARVIWLTPTDVSLNSQ